MAEAHVADGGAAFRTLRRVVDVRPGEAGAMVLACLYFFFTLSSYFILRPIRDAYAVAAGVSQLPWLFLGTLAATLVANPLFSALVARFPVKRFIVITYAFFAGALAAFWLASQAGLSEMWAGRIFWVFTSVYNLFVVSVFWSFMADAFRSEQAKRLFGFIGVGGTMGSIAGSATSAFLARAIGPVNLLLVSATLLLVAATLVVAFPMRRVAAEANETPEETARRERHVIGGSVWAGFTRVGRSPYLAAIAGFLVLYVLGSTVLYFAQTEIVGRHYADRASRTEFLARVELAAQVLTVVTQVFLTGRIMRGIGIAATLAIMPAISVIGFAAIGASAWGLVPVLATYVTFAVLRRSSNFALTNPAMEALFTVVSREDKYKAKSFIETFVYRAGDQLGAWGYAGLAALGLALTGISWVAVPLSVAFLALGVWLGRRQREMAKDEGRGARVSGERQIAIAR